MARTSKKGTAGMPLPRRFHAGIYARLSVEGTEQKNESIDTQIAIAKQYLKDHPEIELTGCYTDLGKTGTNFRREGFERMMQDVRKKNIDCVIVKDLSRFGRNHIETGNYIQRIFPFMGVRFIALADGIDTFGEASGTDEMTVNLKNLINELYARDIAEKVRTSRRISQEQGSYTGGIPPYGYQAGWVDGKKCLFPCPETSGIVKDIFEWFLAGKNLRQIAGILYERGLHRPGVYRKTGHVYRQEGEILEQWPSATVKFLLTNPVYMGCLVQGTTCGKHGRGRQRHEAGREDCRVIYGTHEPLVGEDMFFRVADLFEKSAAKYCNADGFSKKVPMEEDIYEGVLFCGDCGRPMARSANVKQLSPGDMVRHYGYHCPYSGRLDKMCCPAKGIGMETLDGLVKAALRQESALSDLRPGRLVKEYESQAEKQKQQIVQGLAQCGKQRELGKRKGSRLYLKYHTGELSLEEFQRSKKELDESLRALPEREERLRCRLDGMEREIKEKSKFLRSLLRCNEKTVLTAEAIRTLIHRIDVYSGHRVKVTFAFCMNDLLPEGGGDAWEEQKGLS